MAGRTLLDDRSARLGHHFVLRTGAAGAADGTDHLAAFHQRNAAARSDGIIQRWDVVEVVELHPVLEDLGLAAELGGGAATLWIPD